MENRFTKPAEDLVSGTADYVNLKIDELKLRTVKGLSVALNKLLLSIMFLTLGGIVLMALAFGGVLLIGKLIGDYAAGAFIVAAFFLLVMFILFLLRKKLFMNGLVKMFVGLFFGVFDKPLLWLMNLVVEGILNLWSLLPFLR